MNHKVADQAVQTQRLIWVFVVRIWHKPVFSRRGSFLHCSYCILVCSRVNPGFCWFWCCNWRSSGRLICFKFSFFVFAWYSFSKALFSLQEILYFQGNVREIFQGQGIVREFYNLLWLMKFCQNIRQFYIQSCTFSLDVWSWCTFLA